MKRFMDTEIWQKAWFQELSSAGKLLVIYIFNNCDTAGVWNINYRLASFIIGEDISEKNIDEINEKNYMFEKFEEDKIFVIDFIKFQYGTLSENCKPHKPIIEKLKKYNLYERVLKGYPKGINTLEYKYKYKEKEKEKEIECFGENLNVIFPKGEYTNLLALTQSRELLDRLIDNLGANIRKGKEKEYSADYPYAHYERIKDYYRWNKTHPNSTSTIDKWIPRKDTQ